MADTTDAPVVEGAVHDGDGLGTFDTYSAEAGKDDGLAAYTDYRMRGRYEEDGHRFLMGITSPQGFQGKSASIVQLALPTLLWIVDWTACRANQKPRYPSTATDDSNWVLLDRHLGNYMVTKLPDSSPLWRLSGTYVFGWIGAVVDIENKLTWPKPPWLNDFDRSFSTQYADRGLIDKPLTTYRTT